MNVPTHAFFPLIPTTMTHHHDRRPLSVMTNSCLALFLNQNWVEQISLIQGAFVFASAIKGLCKQLRSYRGLMPMPCWWALMKQKQLSMAVQVIWLCACVRYWPYCGVYSRVYLLAKFGLTANITHINTSVCHWCLRSSEHVWCRQFSIALQITAVSPGRLYGKPGLYFKRHVEISY